MPRHQGRCAVLQAGLAAQAQPVGRSWPCTWRNSNGTSHTEQQGRRRPCGMCKAPTDPIARASPASPLALALGRLASVLLALQAQAAPHLSAEAAIEALQPK